MHPGYRALPWAVSLLLLVLLFPGCSDRQELQRLENKEFSEIVQASGWPSVDGKDDFGLVGKLFSDCSSSHDGAVSCGGNRAVFKRNDRSYTLLQADPKLAWQQDVLTVTHEAPLLVTPRYEEIDHNTRGTSIQWEGCFVNRLEYPVEPLAMRVSLLYTVDGQPVSVVGKPRKTTSRSGVPKEVKSQDFFCTKLTSSRVKINPARVDHAVLVVEGYLRIGDKPWVGPLRILPVEDRFPTGGEFDAIGVAMDGELRKKPSTKKQSIEVNNPMLLEFSRRDGLWYLGRSSDGFEGWIRRDHLLGIWPKTTAMSEVSDSLRHFVENRCVEDEGGFCPAKDQPHDLTIRVLDRWEIEDKKSCLFFASYTVENRRSVVLIDAFLNETFPMK